MPFGQRKRNIDKMRSKGKKTKQAGGAEAKNASSSEIVIGSQVSALLCNALEVIWLVLEHLRILIN